MNEQEQWQRDNEAYLAAAVQWVRLRLQQLVGLAEPASVEPIRQAAAAMTAAEDTNPPPALLILSQRFGLSTFEQELLLLCAAIELDTRVAGLCAQFQGNAGQPYPTFALAMALFDKPVWEALSPERPLRFWRLIEISQPGAQPLTLSPLRIDERILNHMKGLSYLDDRLAPFLVPFDLPAEAVELSASQQSVVTKIVQKLRQLADTGIPPIVQLVGLDTLSKQLVAKQVATILNLHLSHLPAELLPTQTSEMEVLARLWQRETFLLPVALYIDAHESEGNVHGEASRPEGPSPLRRFLARSQGMFFLSTREMHSDLGPRATAVHVDKPSPAEQRAAWEEALQNQAPESPTLLAGQFNLNITIIRQIAREAMAEANGSSQPIHRRVWQACLIHTSPRLELLAERLEPKVSWDDIVLPEETIQLLRQIVNQVAHRSRVYDEWGFRQKMSRGLGINALFAGDSGTGKTMAAEVLANHLSLSLYRIDLSAVVSKYIGETEKNLRRLFDAAEDGSAILFFDEADALFGKRSEVKDSHDRYANIEINYLLQRMEAYRGLAILATNMKEALDRAFMRRLRFIVNFPFPGPKERYAIWQKVFPLETPRQDLDFERLSRFNVAGGSIHNIAVNAAFAAAQAGLPVTMPTVLEAARAEFRKLEQPVNEAQLRWDGLNGGGR